MKASDKPGFFKSLFGLEERAPARAAIPLYIPLSMKSEKEASGEVESAWRRVMRQRLGPLVVLQEASRYLEKINPMPLSYGQRARLTNMLLHEVVTAIGMLFNRFFQHGGGVPETKEQRASISYAMRAAEQLAISYKLLFRSDWADPTQDRAVHERILVIVLHILECVHLEQLLRAFRYQKLPRQAWRDINQLFFALRGEWDVKAKHPRKVRLALGEAASRLDLFPGMASLETLYLSIQMLGLLDVISWPIPWMYRVGRYLSEKEADLVSIPDRGEAIPVGHVIVYRDQGMPPRFKRGRGSLQEALLVDLNPLLCRVKKDREAVLTSAGASAVSETLREIPEQDRAAFLDLLLLRLQPQQRRDARQRVFDAHGACVYGGFDAVHRLFRDISRRDEYREDVAEERLFWDVLASHTSIVAVNDGLSPESRWVIADESGGGVLLRQREGDYSMALYVGRLVAYNTGGEGFAGSRLGYVTRLQRIGDDEVEVAIARLREDVQAVMAVGVDVAEQRALPALLIRDVDGKLQLLCDNKHTFMTGRYLVVLNESHRHRGVLGDMILAQADFTVFEFCPQE